MRKKHICVLMCVILMSSSTIALADWSPGDGHKMHFPQLPDANGWDVDWGLVYLADDWKCSETGFIKDIHFWISWWNDQVQDIPWIYVSIWSNNPEGPHGWSVPNELLWEKTFQEGEFIIAGPWDGNQGWLNPPSQYYPDNHQKYYQINIPEIVDPYLQNIDKIYWLVIKMPFDDQYICGWKTTLDSYLDNAVFSTVPINTWWIIDGIDLAFVINGEPPIPELVCDGNIIWLEVPPGTTISGNFQIGNIGEVSSLLDWYVDNWPSWGSWDFSPNSGTGLPTGNWINITVTVEAPIDKNQNFTGNITIVNADDPSNYCEIPVFLQTPRNKFTFNQIFIKFFTRIFQCFQILQWLKF
ncbi:MAG: hypothetical protein AYK22_06915 [Thermoplasmatales archaeon SG8-52-3]|nr:MAG: hypothetical protein AYK22_06915 [Thermoplasmatales archaeon SG8-52-3]